MAASSIAGKSRPATRSVRVRRCKPSSSVKHSSSTADDNGRAKHQTTIPPDTEELRRIRTAYFAPAIAGKSKIVRPTSLPKKPSSLSTTKSPSIRASERQRKVKTTTTSFRKQIPPSRSRHGSTPSDFVYGPPPAVDHPNKHSRKKSLDSRSNLSAIPEAEVTPDDSVSVVAERRASRSSLPNSSTSLRRKRSTPSKMDTIQEDHASPAKKESSFFGSFFGRPQPPPQAPPRMVECLTCGSDDIPRPHSAKLACGHRMCHECLKRIFTMSVKDPAHMPPRCCTDDHIPLKHVEKLFDLKFKTLWNRKYEEYHTRNRVYCPSPRCGEWIKPSHIHKTLSGQKVAQCPRCKTKVCPTCSNLLHRSRDCPRDPEIIKLVEQAKEQGWQRCYKCHAMVELKEGCNHMTCRCMAEFCMKCGAKWKSCECPWFNYTHLPSPDRLNEMRVPVEIQVLYRRVFAAGLLGRQEGQEEYRGRDVTYQDELAQRRRQERLDEDLAQRLQLATLMEDDGIEVQEDDREREARRRRRERQQQETFGIANAGGHLMNETYVQDGDNAAVGDVGDAGFGRRGDRSSGRRRRARRTEQQMHETGLVNDFLGDESVVGR